MATNKILAFDKRPITAKELSERVNYYDAAATKIMDISKFDRQKALALLKELNKSLNTEIKYYQLAKVEREIQKTKGAASYVAAITEAYEAQTNKNSFHSLYNNVFKICQCLKKHCRDYLLMNTADHYHDNWKIV